MDDWNHVTSVIASLVELEEECTIELADAVGSSTPSGASLRQLASNVMGIRVELRLDVQGDYGMIHSKKVIMWVSWTDVGLLTITRVP